MNGVVYDIIVFSGHSIQRAAQRSGAVDPAKLLEVLRYAGIVLFNDMVANGRPKSGEVRRLPFPNGVLLTAGADDDHAAFIMKTVLPASTTTQRGEQS